MTRTDETRKVLMDEAFAIGLGADRVVWGEPDADGFYTPALYKERPPVLLFDTPEAVEKLAQAITVVNKRGFGTWLTDVPEEIAAAIIEALRGDHE